MYGDETHRHGPPDDDVTVRIAPRDDPAGMTVPRGEPTEAFDPLARRAPETMPLRPPAIPVQPPMGAGPTGTGSGTGPSGTMLTGPGTGPGGTRLTGSGPGTGPHGTMVTGPGGTRLTGSGPGTGPSGTIVTGSRRVGEPSGNISLRIGNGVVPPPVAPAAGRSRAGRIIRVLSGILTVVLVIGVSWTAWQWWQWWHNRVAVDSVSVALAENKTGCDVEYDVVGTIATNGKPGKISYEWVRSDGKTSGTLTQTVASGPKTTVVHLTWKITGKGDFTAVATLHVLSPTKADGQTSFDYSCG